jgi:hypothetical protein
VTAAPERHWETALAAEADGGHHVGDAGAARDQRRAAIDRAVPDLAVLVVVGPCRADELSAEPRLQLGQGPLIECRVGGNRDVAIVTRLNALRSRTGRAGRIG